MIIVEPTDPPSVPDGWMQGWGTMIRHLPERHLADDRWWAYCGEVCTPVPVSQEAILTYCAACPICERAGT